MVYETSPGKQSGRKVLVILRQIFWTCARGISQLINHSTDMYTADSSVILSYKTDPKQWRECCKEGFDLDISAERDNPFGKEGDLVVAGEWITTKILHYVALCLSKQSQK